MGPKILHKKIQVISSKNEGVTAIFAILDFFFFFFKGLDIVTFIEFSALQYYFIIIFFFFQGLDIVTLLGAEGP